MTLCTAFAEPEIASERVVDVQATVASGSYVSQDSWLPFQQLRLSMDAVGLITHLEDGYRVIRPIPYEITQVDGGFLASFPEANIAISGFNAQDAYQSLVAEILDTFDALDGSPQRGLDAAAQFDILTQYIVRA